MSQDTTREDHHSRAESKNRLPRALHPVKTGKTPTDWKDSPTPVPSYLAMLRIQGQPVGRRFIAGARGVCTDGAQEWLHGKIHRTLYHLKKTF